MSLNENIIKFTSLVQNWAANISDMFFSDIAKDITIKVLDESGNIVEKQLPNHKKMRESFEYWKTQIGVKNTNGEVTDLNGEALSVSKFGGMTLSEYDEMYKLFQNKTKVKLIPNQKGNSMVGYYLMAVVTENNKIYAWGMSNGSILSYGLNTNFHSIVELQQSPDKMNTEITKIFVSGQHIGVLYSDGDLYLRGYQSQGHFGIGNTATQVKFMKSAENVVDYITSAHGDQDEQPSAAYIDTEGSVWRAGDNSHGELGDGTAVDKFSWVKVYDASIYTNDKAKKVMVNGTNVAHMAVLTENGKFFVSGYNGYGQLGNGTTGNVSLLSQILPMTGGAKIIDVIAGGYYDAGYYGHTHLLTDNGKVYSCGYNGNGECCVGSTATPITSFSEINYGSLDPITDPIVEIQTSYLSLYILTASGSLYSSGYNNYGQLGLGNTTTQTSLSLVMGNVKKFYTAVGADASQYPACWAITNENKMFSWGNLNYGWGGFYATGNHATPTLVPFDSIGEIEDFCHSGYSDNCALFAKLKDGTFYGVGSNNYNITMRSPNQDGYHAEWSIIKV